MSSAEVTPDQAPAAGPRAAARRLRRGPVALVAVLALLAAAAGAYAVVESRSDALLPLQADPVDLDWPVPTYALGTREGILVASGGEPTLVRGASWARFLPDGTVLVTFGRGDDTYLQRVDAATGELVPGRVRQRYSELPSRAVTRWNLLREVDSYPTVTALDSVDATTGEVRRVPLPQTDDPDAVDGRGYHGGVPTIGPHTFVQWSDDGEDYEFGEDGVLQVSVGADGEVDTREVMVDQRVVALYLAADGASLTALRQSRGEPCGGCDVDQDIAEVDVETGTLVDHGHPPGYDESWRVEAVDRVGDRIAVRYRRGYWTGPEDEVYVSELVGTWVLEDGEWSLLPGSDEVVTWWQEGGRVLGRLDPDEADGLDGYALSWAADGSEEEVPLRGEVTAAFPGGNRYRDASVPGQLLPPE